MWREHVVAVIVPAYQEERIVARTLRGIPAFVDAIYVVDDASLDATAQKVGQVEDSRVQLVRHEVNRGVGAAIATGYRRAVDDKCELLVVMAADDQMDPRDLPGLLDAVLEPGVDYAKGNRFLHPECRGMPLARRYGSRALSAVTRLTTRLRVSDCQCGFTALRASAARRLPLEHLWPRYGYPNDLLGMLAAARCRVVDIAVRPVYADEDSGLRAHHMATIGFVIARRWWLSRCAAQRGRRGWPRQAEP